MYDIFMLIIEKMLFSFIIVIGLLQIIDSISCKVKKNKAL